MEPILQNFIIFILFVDIFWESHNWWHQLLVMLHTSFINTCISFMLIASSICTTFRSLCALLPQWPIPPILEILSAPHRTFATTKPMPQWTPLVQIGLQHIFLVLPQRVGMQNPILSDDCNHQIYIKNMRSWNYVCFKKYGDF